MVEGSDAYNSLGFATGANCWCFLVSSVSIWPESRCISEWINLKLCHPPPPHLWALGHTLYLEGVGNLMFAWSGWGIWAGNVNLAVGHTLYLEGVGNLMFAWSGWGIWAGNVNLGWQHESIDVNCKWMACSVMLQKLYVCIFWYLLKSAVL